MASNYTFPGNTNTYVPTLHADLQVKFIRNPAKFKINSYVDFRRVDKMRGFYLNWKNDGQARITDLDTFAWADGSEVPMNTQTGDAVEYPEFNCKRYFYGDTIGYLAVEQASWDVLDMKAAEQTMKGMTARTLRISNTLSTSANYLPANVLNSTGVSGGGGVTWANATSAAPAIRASIMQAAIQIQQSSLAVVELKDLYVVINPLQAKTIALSQEWIDFIKQSPDSLPIWKNDQQYNQYNIPSMLFGVNVVVEDAIYVSTFPGPNAVTPTYNYCFPNNVAAVVTKQQAIPGYESAAFSTFTGFVYDEFTTYVYNDVRNRRYELQITENIDDSFLFSQATGVLINTNS